MSLGEQAAQVCVTLRCFGQKRDMMPVLGLLEARKALPEGDFGARDRLEIGPFCRVGELHGAVEPVVIRERERRVAELHRAHGQFLGMRRAVQERKT